MDIRHLEYFSEVAKHSSFTKAALTLHVSQPSLSKAIKQLEAELEVPLFYRSKTLELTDAGKALLVNVKEVLNSFHNLNSELNRVIDLKKGEINIGIPPIIGASFFSKLISQYVEEYPLVDLKLEEVGSKMIKQGVEDGSLDIGLVCNVPSRNGKFEMMKIVDDPLKLVVNKSNRLSLKNSVHMKDLQHEGFILYREDFTLHDRIMEECANHGFYPNVVCHSSQRDFMIEMVDARLGIALLPSKVADEIMNPHIKSIPLVNSSASLELGMVWKKNKYIPHSVREFINMAETHLSYN
ncbi:LysR family transcriptional regulator [Bacillus carboniphilus]|uniref:LysR family transcriptional regulator n=1 Tax=Bacillus carboniphilus TaxID=86663 RepID=A0ABY9JS26_9BACI|nr:LysR family transcriptional regulator [Bacillus carboniphilus]WLR42191.1 LysR family transcriptional regulator [Bacillus carboniphilus]